MKKIDKFFWCILMYFIVIAIWLMVGKAECAPFNRNITSTNSGRIRTTSRATYVSARDTTAGAADTDFLSIGQTVTEGANYGVYRSFLTFAIPTTWKVTACTLYVNATSSFDDTTDFEIYILSAPNYATLDNGDFDQFDGRVAGGAHTGTILNDVWSTTSWVAGWNAFTFNAAGLDTIEAHSNGSLRIALISKEDYNNSSPTGSESVAFANTAYIKLYYEADANTDRRLLQKTYLWNNGTPSMLWRP